MRVPINLDSLNIVDETSFNLALSPQQLAWKRGDSELIQFVFGRRFAAAEELENGGSLTSFKFGAKQTGDYQGDYVISNYNGAVFAVTKTFPITIADLVTNTSTAASSATAGFAASDVGKVIMGPGIPANTTIAAVQSATNILLSVAATASATVTATILKRTPVYTVNPLNSHELNKLLIDGTVRADVADQTARYALVGWSNGDIAYQQSDGTSWEVLDHTQLSSSAGWGPAAQKESVTLIAELEWIVNGYVTSTVTFSLVVSSDVNRGGEGVPSPANPQYPTPRQLIVLDTTVTGYTGGGSTNLDGLATTGIDVSSVPYVLAFLHATEGLRVFKLATGTSAESSPGVIRPDDYNGSTNAKVWTQML